jgi:hypothetical protein
MTPTPRSQIPFQNLNTNQNRGKPLNTDTKSTANDGRKWEDFRTIFVPFPKFHESFIFLSISEVFQEKKILVCLPANN